MFCLKEEVKRKEGSLAQFHRGPSVKPDCPTWSSSKEGFHG